MRLLLLVGLVEVYIADMSVACALNPFAVVWDHDLSRKLLPNEAAFDVCGRSEFLLATMDACLLRRSIASNRGRSWINRRGDLHTRFGCGGGGVVELRFLPLGLLCNPGLVTDLLFVKRSLRPFLSFGLLCDPGL